MAKSPPTQSSNDEKPPFLATMDAVLNEFGGFEALAAEFVRTYQAAKEGSAIKAQMLKNIMDLLKMQLSLAPEQETYEDVSEEQLMAMFRELDAKKENSKVGEEADSPGARASGGAAAPKS